MEAASLTWAISLLCQDPDIQTRLRPEIRTNLSSPSEISLPSSTQLPSTASPTSKPSARKPYASAPLSSSSTAPPSPKPPSAAARSPRGTDITLAAVVTRQSPTLWGTDAKDFNTERWMMGANRYNNTGAAMTTNLAFSSFSHGLRTCAGMGSSNCMD